MRFPLAFSAFLLLLSGCSSTPLRKPPVVYQAGEKAAVGPLSYSVVDTTYAQMLGEEPALRTPQNRFVIVQVSVTNGGNADASIPGMSLIDDSGKVFTELADGTGVARWLGVVRKVAPAQTDQGAVVFDAPAKHFRLKLTDEFEDDVSIDLPLSFIHELQHDVTTVPDRPPVIEIPKK